jgi:methyl-accepting chemotaxis protein
MREMVASRQRASVDSQSASELARRAVGIAEKGGSIVNESLQTMNSIADSVRATAQRIGELGQSSRQIGKIIAVIKEIADQTNLLALNTAIEAAPAGEQGRGFAVVACEVRSLAERTATATQEIAQTINTVQRETEQSIEQSLGTSRVESGVEATSRTGGSLEKIIAAAEEVGNMISRISSAASQQGGSAVSINSHLEQMSHYISESTDNAQESAQSCRRLAELSASLKAIIGQFQFRQIIFREGDSRAAA